MFCAIYNSATSSLIVGEKTTCDPSEIQLLTSQEIGPMLASPFNLSMADGGLVGAAVLLTWAVAFGWKSAIKSLNNGSPD